MTAPKPRNQVGARPGPQTTRAMKAARIAAIAPAVTAASFQRDGGFSVLTIGAVGMRPAPCDDVTGASGSWITTAFAGAAGIVIDFLHFGQGPVRPANWSLTENRDLQPEQTTWIGMAPPAESEKQGQSPRRNRGSRRMGQCQSLAVGRQGAHSHARL